MAHNQISRYRVSKDDLQTALEHWHYLRDQYYRFPNLWARNAVVKAKAEYRRLSDIYHRERGSHPGLFFDDRDDI